MRSMEKLLLVIVVACATAAGVALVLWQGRIYSSVDSQGNVIALPWPVVGAACLIPVVMGTYFFHLYFSAFVRGEVEMKAGVISRTYDRTGTVEARSWGGRLHGGTVAIEGTVVHLEERFLGWRVTRSFELASDSPERVGHMNLRSEADR